MRKLLTFLINKWVLSFIGVTALALLVWFGADFVGFGEEKKPLSSYTRIIVILIFYFAWILWRVISWAFEKRQNSQLLNEIEEAEKQAPVNPDEQRTDEELSQIGSRFKDALSTLKQSKFKATGNSKSLYQLPWYIIIGPPGSGKTTALINSGLDFPLAQSLGKGALGGIGGTRNCDWWFTNEAVLIDTAGRYTTQDSHRTVDNAAWHHFLELLKKYRRRRPINGAVVAISIQDMMVQTEEQRLQHAKTIRTRIDELQKQLGIRFPVYLMFTKCDLVAGFSEFFSNLSQSEREQVWGTSFPIDAETSSMLQSFQGHYDALVQRLNQRLLWRMHSERNAESRALMQGFPNRLDSLRETLSNFINAAFATNKYHEAPMLRGVYFTSGTQEGTPIDRMMASVSSSFGLPRDMGAQQHNLGKSFFLGRLLKDVIFPESELVGVNRKLEALMKWGRRAGFAAIAAVSVIAILIWTGSVTRNKMFMSEVNEQINQYREAKVKLRPNESDPVRTLATLNPLLQASLVYDKEDHPILTGLGLYDSNVDDAAKSLYQSKLREYFMPSFLKSIERRLSGLRAEDPHLLPTLKTYLMLHDSTHRNTPAIEQWADQRWQQQLPNRADEQEELKTHLNHLLQQEAIQEPPDERVVRRARSELSRIPTSQRLYAQMKSDTSQAVDLYSRIGGDSELVFGLRPDSPVFSTDFMFTKEGWKKADYKPDSPLMEQLDQNRWIYGDESVDSLSPADRERLSSEIERAYFNEFSRNWRRFLSQFKIARFNNMQGALDSLRLLSDPTYSPILTVLELASENTSLRPPIEVPKIPAGATPAVPVSNSARVAGALAKSAAGDAIDKIEPTPVDNDFRELHRLMKSSNNRPAQIQAVLADINALYEVMNEIDTSGDSNKAAFNLARSRFEGGGSDPIRQLHRKAATVPAPLKHWLGDIANNSWSLILLKTKLHLNTAWDDEVESFYQQRLAGRYPFGSANSNDASLADFKKFFGAEGVQQTFIQDYLKPFLDTRRWRPNMVDAAGIHFKDETLQQFKLANQIRSLFTTGGNIELTFEHLKLYKNFEELTLDIGQPKSRSLQFRHGPRVPKTARWRMGEHERARVLVKHLGESSNADVMASYNGIWAWLRLLQSANSRGSNLLEFNLGGHPATFKLTAKANGGKFNPAILRSYRNPTDL